MVIRKTNTQPRLTRSFRSAHEVARRWVIPTLFGAAVGVPLSVPSTALAADASDTGLSIDEVIVTATKFKETAHDVPMSITALSAATIEQAGIQDFHDYAQKVPNLTFSGTFGVQDGLSVAIRGVQGNGTTGFYIDDLPIPAGLNPRVMDDIQRIEVLRGPQGTLYGARSMGGTVRLITEPPNTMEFSGKVSIQGSDIEDGRPGYQVDGVVNLPLIKDTLALRLSAFKGSNGPFIRREWPDAVNPDVLDSTLTARNDFKGGMASLLWQANENLTVRATVMSQVSDYNGWPMSDFYVTPTTHAYTAGSLLQRRFFDIPEYDNQNWTFGGITVNYSTPVGDITSATSYFREHSDNREDISEFLYNGFLGPFYGAASPLPAPIDSWNYPHSFVEELRFASKFSGPLQFVMGLYVSRTSANNGQYNNVPGADAATGGALGTDLGYYSSDLNQDYEDAVFGELTYHFTSQFSTTVGLRESHVYTSSSIPWSGFVVTGTTGGGGSNTQNQFTPKVVFKYDQNANVNYYALASKGFRPGNGQVAPPLGICGDDYASNHLNPADISSYKADSLWNYEVGTKIQTSDRRFSLNLDGYQINWKDLQQGSRFTCGFVFTVNAGAARSRGSELELSLEPTRGLHLTAGVGYEDAIITQSSPALRTKVGSPVQQVAPWTVSTGVDYTFPLTTTWNGLLRADYSFTDRSFSANEDPNNPRLRPSYEIVNLRAGVSSNHYDISLFVDNASNTHANLGDSASEAGEDPGRPRILTNQPRTYGLRATYRF
jgi:outer membrane receptor protein involved in Fe transport